MTDTVQIPFDTYGKSVPEILERIGADSLVAGAKRILIKPNLVNDSPFPVTTPPALCREVILWLRARTRAEIIIAEGCGDAELETDQVFQNLRYDRMAADLGVALMDLNHAPLVRLTNPANRIFPEFFLPKIATQSFILSLPVLKAHSLARVTGTLKNMMGFAPPKHYSGGGYWKKAAFHEQMHRAIRELNSYILPDLTLMDGSVGLSQYHLGGPPCSPPANRLIAGTDPYGVDQAAAELLGLDPNAIAHLWPAAQ